MNKNFENGFARVIEGIQLPTINLPLNSIGENLMKPVLWCLFLAHTLPDDHSASDQRKHAGEYPKNYSALPCSRCGELSEKYRVNLWERFVSIFSAL